MPSVAEALRTAHAEVRTLISEREAECDHAHALGDETALAGADSALIDAVALADLIVEAGGSLRRSSDEARRIHRGAAAARNSSRRRDLGGQALNGRQGA